MCVVVGGTHSTGSVRQACGQSSGARDAGEGECQLAYVEMLPSRMASSRVKVYDNTVDFSYTHTHTATWSLHFDVHIWLHENLS